ncbi:hypothetical protein ACLMJK_003875 [Lecanora helva]
MAHWQIVPFALGHESPVGEVVALEAVIVDADVLEDVEFALNEGLTEGDEVDNVDVLEDVEFTLNEGDIEGDEAWPKTGISSVLHTAKTCRTEGVDAFILNNE